MSILESPGSRVGGLTGLSTAVVPSGVSVNTYPGSTSSLLSTPQQLTNQIIPPLTNQITAATSSPVQLVPSLNSSLSPATGVSPLRPSPVLSLSPVSPGLGAAAVGPTSQFATAQPLTHGGMTVPSSAVLQSTLLSPPPARRVLLPPSSLISTSQPPLLPMQQRPLISAVPLQQPSYPQAVPMQPSFQPSFQQSFQPSFQPSFHPVMVQQQPQQYTQLVPVSPPSAFLQPRPHPMGVAVPQQPLFYQPSLALQPQLQMAPSPQYMAMAPTNPLIVPQHSPQQLAAPGTMFVAGAAPAIM